MSEHPFLFIPGPTNVRPDVLNAQTEAMIGHRTPDFEHLYATCEAKLKQIFFTEGRVYTSASSGSGMQEAAIRNGVSHTVVNFINGAFSTRWHQISHGCGKQAINVEVEWGQAITPELVDTTLAAHPDAEAITVVHNETSVGVASPVGEIAALVHEKYPHVLLFVDAVSSLSGVRLPFDEWKLDIMLTSSQKALNVPPGLSFAAVSDRTLEKAATVEGRGWYFDFLLLEKYHQKNTTPSTPAISLMRALNVALDHILAEGLEARFARHQAMSERTQQWVADRGFEMFSAAGYHSPTVSNIVNTRHIDIGALNTYLREHGMVISNGYGPLKEKAFRIGHMGDISLAQLDELLSHIDQFLEMSAG